MYKEDCCFVVAIVTVLCLLAGLGTFIGMDEYRKPRYYAAIDSVSGLDLGRPSSLLDPVFNVTLRVASLGFRHRECIAPGTVVEVSYHGSPLASGAAGQLCARPRGGAGAREESLVAWGRGVRVPGFALDGLAANARQGVQAFDVTLQMPPTDINHHMGKVVTCSARRAGDAGALEAPCDSSDMGQYWLPSPTNLHGGANSTTSN